MKMTAIDKEPARPSTDLTAAYNELRGSLLAFLRRLTGDAHVAEDLLHDVMLKALTQSSPDQVPRNLTGWLYAVARNAAMDFHRARRPAEALQDDIPEPEPSESEDDKALIELANCLRSMAERLPPRYRDTVLATELDGRPLKTVAADQGLSLSAIKSRASRGRRMLHEELIRCCHVLLADSGKVVDYDQQAAQQCLPQHDKAECQGIKSCRN